MMILHGGNAKMIRLCSFNVTSTLLINVCYSFNNLTLDGFLDIIHADE